MFSIPGLENWHVAVFLSAIFVLVVAFIIRQTWHKVRSAAITGQFNYLIRELPSRRTHADLMKANCYNKKKLKAIWDFISMGWSGHLILGVVYSFFLAQMVALCGVCYWKTTFPGRWILLPALPYILPLLAIVLPLLTFLWNKVKKKK